MTLSDDPLAQQTPDHRTEDRYGVYLVEDQTVLRDALGASLEIEPGFQLIGQAPDAERALEDITILEADVVLMDIGLPGINGIEATRRLKENHSYLSIVILTAHGDEYLESALDAGAVGYLQKSCTREELLQGIRVAAADAPHTAPVSLRVEVTGSVERVVDLVRELRQDPDFKLLQIRGNFSWLTGWQHPDHGTPKRVDICVGLRRLVDAAQALLAMEGVIEVGTVRLTSSGDEEAAVTVRLAGGLNDRRALSLAGENGQLSFESLEFR